MKWLKNMIYVHTLNQMDMYILLYSFVEYVANHTWAETFMNIFALV